MVKIINYKERKREDGTSFFVLEISGGIEMILSQATGQFYATAKKTNISCTFDEMVCQSLLGTELPGNIIKLECEPYKYMVKNTGEIIMLSHRYVYLPEDNYTESQKVSAVSGSTAKEKNEYTQRELAEHHAFSLNEELV